MGILFYFDVLGGFVTSQEAAAFLASPRCAPWAAGWRAQRLAALCERLEVAHLMGVDRDTLAHMEATRQRLAAELDPAAALADVLEADTWARVAWLHYAEGKPWEACGLAVHYSGESCARNAGRGLEAIGQALEAAGYGAVAGSDGR